MRSLAFNLGGGGSSDRPGFFRQCISVTGGSCSPSLPANCHAHFAGYQHKNASGHLVDIMPESLSGETENDSEPNIAVNPAHPRQIAVSAFTREPMRRSDRAPIFVSTDAGNSWSLRSILRSRQITCDCTLRFGSSSGVLYVSALRNEMRLGGNRKLIICQSRRVRHYAPNR